MIATGRGRKFNNNKDNNNGVNRNRENIGAGFSRFQILDQVTEDSVNPTHVAMKYNPSTSHQPTIMANLNPIFNANCEDRTITPARRKQHTTAVTAKLQRKTPTAPMNETRNPFPQSALTIREENINYPPHANPQITAGLNPQPNPSHQQMSPYVTTLDPKKHTVVFCATQDPPSGDVGEAASEHRDQLGLEFKHLSDPPDAHNTPRVNDGNSQAHQAALMGENDGEEMSEEEDSMVEETPLALMTDVNEQH